MARARPVTSHEKGLYTYVHARIACKIKMAAAAEACVLTEVRRHLSEGSGSLRILITGRTGAGKSALVNSIVGEYVAEEGDSPYGQTTDVTIYEKNIEDVTVTIYDSPGLQDGIRKNLEEAYLKDLEEKCKEVDLILYCIRMNDKMRPSEYDAIVKLSRAFGMDKFWQNTLFVLTFANEISLPKNQSSASLPDYFKQRMSEWEGILQKALTEKAEITVKIAENVPVVPAGYFDEPFLPGTNSDYWLSRLWWQCLFRTGDGAKPILLKINRERLRTSKEVEAKADDIRKKKGWQQPIVKDVAGSYTAIDLSNLVLKISLEEKSTKTTDNQESTTTPRDQLQEAKLTSPPTLAELQVLKIKGKEIRIIEKMAGKWVMLGDLMKFDDRGTKVKNIKQEYSDSISCCREIFECWIRGEGVQCSWKKLVELLGDCKEAELAKEIKDALL